LERAVERVLFVGGTTPSRSTTNVTVQNPSDGSDDSSGGTSDDDLVELDGTDLGVDNINETVDDLTDDVNETLDDLGVDAGVNTDDCVVNLLGLCVGQRD
jgi:hypothetical protein